MYANVKKNSIPKKSRFRNPGCANSNSKSLTERDKERSERTCHGQLCSRTSTPPTTLLVEGGKVGTPHPQADTHTHTPTHTHTHPHTHVALQWLNKGATLHTVQYHHSIHISFDIKPFKHILGYLSYQRSTFDVFPNYLIKEIPCLVQQTFCLYIQFYDILPPATSKATIISFMVPLFCGVQLRMSLYIR